MRSRIEPMKKVARQLRRHRPLLLNWFHARGEISAAIEEGFNNKAKLTSRKAYGFRSYRCLEIGLYRTLGQLPKPEATHRFCWRPLISAPESNSLAFQHSQAHASATRRFAAARRS